MLGRAVSDFLPPHGMQLRLSERSASLPTCPFTGSERDTPACAGG